MKNNLDQDRKNLLKWYLQHQRSLPWRKSKDAYRIWISEVMLQQTTVTAVIPFYEKFISRFPNVQALSSARIEDVYEYWAGLGYYSRARNLHKSAQMIVQKHNSRFPESFQELIELPGFGPYTARAVASLAYDQRVGVLDGNVIRILTRKYGLDLNWWETVHRNKLQVLADQLANTDQSAHINQAMMELGATICTPKKVMCLLCPWIKSCKSYHEGNQLSRPRSKPKADFEMWQWHFKVLMKKKEQKIYLAENTQTPFLKKNWLPFSQAKKISKKPKTFHFKHGVTKYDIFVTVEKMTSITLPKASSGKGKWIPLNQISQINPTSLAKKIIKAIE